ncbi:L-aminoadipate-semialdehyde dehydrogenase-phosphopantetheinyl transferase-like [Babylonia areolata]|uniref:L-aminoadipate-semialdehyde dehydrogenase-phosphopantetheinyl transferase-like n=1 Tax=Babylonia areolata TaxID=304850 RepID=UPI003FD182D9
MLPRGSVRLAVKAKAWNPTQQEWTLAAQCIQSEEKDRIGRFVFKKDAKSAMVGRLLIRRVVSSMLNIPYHSVKLGRTDKGKPVTLNDDGQTPRLDCSFNISHQGDYVILAAEDCGQVGADIMKVEWPRKTSVQDFFRLMSRHLTELEWAAVRSRSGDMEQLQVFYRIWCLKESVLKAFGTGIGFEMSRLEFHMAGTDLSPDEVTSTTTMKVDGTPATYWHFEETMLEDHCVTVAHWSENLDKWKTPPGGAGSDNLQRFMVWSIEELLSGCAPLLGSLPDQAYWENFAAKQEAPALS